MQPYQINELEELANYLMNYSKNPNPIVTADTLINAVRNKQFIVGSFTQSIGFSASTTPVPHSSRALARQECSRLAKINPGKLFIFLELSGAEMVPAVISTVSI